MATIKYNGVEIQSITECKVFEEPRIMLVWNTSYDGPIVKMVCAIIPYRHAGSVITMCGAFEYCAEIPKKTEPRRATNRELAKWIAQGKGEWGISKFGVIEKAEIGWFYDTGYEEQTLQSILRVRKWDDTEWHEPTVDYMDIGTNAGEKE